MRRFKVLSVACMTVFVLIAMATASAVAFTLPEVLGIEVGAKWTMTGSNSKWETLAGNKIECEKVAGEGTVEAGKTLGPFHVTLSGKCKGTISGISAPCTGLGDLTETILLLGKWHTVVDTKKGATLGAAILLLLEPAHFTCSIALIELKGSILCLITTPLTSNASHTVTCAQTAGMASETKYLNDAEVEVAIEPLLSAVSHGTFEENGLALVYTMTFATAVTLDD